MEGIHEEFVVGDNVEVTPFHKVVKVFEGQVNGQQVTVEGAVLLLGGNKLREKCTRGHHMLSICCWRTAPTAELEASVKMQVGASG